MLSLSPSPNLRRQALFPQMDARATTSLPSAPMPAVSSIVLQNNELLTLICQAFLPFDPSPSLPPQREVLNAGRAHLRNIALVCRAFAEPAQACMWTHLDSLLPLVQLLPNAQISNGVYVSPYVPPHNIAYAQSWLLLISAFDSISTG